ncbi:MAG: HAD family hydrolase [Mesorhizobium sp.]|uniref:cation-translocating P-type ATPase n=1 Tax=unclassified Mesorhizobium TaxID=325217 RepID=UPI000FCCBDEF|nr:MULTISPECIES: HAD-IC family P-type ATPase [unclassified Mesorhizobium]RUV74877.1 HAD family hydrolase [Mesorhizobium sp. M5C.F.Cr.IN.023.01.1.1]RWF88711.1 MAG: HAD family hydrolase [Mesorhizobium sp.]RWF92969.1 MAG: HAD family hydrolase [Mesorhizobium sp.]RWI41521.1 MAG: HAD family hydrolase [Mesorhizobium sp.]RWI49742.1 MAG: HAD family hydrolase [Mesorhizobium sp.]
MNAVTRVGDSGLSQAEAADRLQRYGRNALPEPKAPSLAVVFFHQFRSPLIYILFVAAVVSAAISDVEDAIFIGIVLLINAVIGTVQEHSAGRAAIALRRLEQPHASVIRDGIRQDIDAREVVPGDVVLLEAGGRVPADLQLLASEDLRCDESLLTGESAPVKKDASVERSDDRSMLAHAGTMVTRGRGRGLVTATGQTTEIGKIAREIAKSSLSRPPLLIRLDAFSRTIALTVGVAIAALVAVGWLRNMDIHSLFLMAVGLAVSAIPEGLPVAISVALAIAMRRMAKANVIARNMTAIEALGSCTVIATDKTGTLTMNELTVKELKLPDGTTIMFEAGHDLDACLVESPNVDAQRARVRAVGLLRAAALPNEGSLIVAENAWKGFGDTVDVALLAAARKCGIVHEEVLAGHPLLTRIPYEPDLKYAASFHERSDRVKIFAKGAPEQLIGMSDRMDIGGTAVPIDRAALINQKEELAGRGLRVLAFAEGEIDTDVNGGYGHRHLVNLVFLGFAGMHDPLRPEVPDAIRACRTAGVDVVMITGDDPKTATAIARDAGLEFSEDRVVTGAAVRQAEDQSQAQLDELTRSARIYARVEPAQKLSIVLSLGRNGQFVAVTGDGVNDAPALKHAHVGVAMGRKGTDVAKESADIIATDDNFASIVGGIREGRVAYANIRKVVAMLVSTGAAEVVLFLLAIPLGLPMPLLPVQLLWLNLVTNGIQDVALAAEKPEGDELFYPPRSPSEPVFDRAMIRRILQATVVMGIGGFLVFWWLLERGHSEHDARNYLLLLFVLFENFQTFNSRSERHSVFSQPISANPLLVIGVVAAQALHIGAMHLPWMRDTLGLTPVSISDWALLLAIAASLLMVSEVDKLSMRWRQRPTAKHLAIG